LFQKVEIPKRGQVPTHAIYGTLLGDAGIVSYDVYRCLENVPWIQRTQKQWLQDQKDPPTNAPGPIVVALVELGNGLDGHVGTVHGGILSLLMDDFLGHAYEALGVPVAVTASLAINFRAPVPAGSQIQLVAQLKSWEGRKLYWTLQVVDPDSKKLYCEATSLYIIPRGAYDEMMKSGFVS
jgi:acyl-coenzyme A thioesterase PaaI-like protein